VARRAEVNDTKSIHINGMASFLSEARRRVTQPPAGLERQR